MPNIFLENLGNLFNLRSANSEFSGTNSSLSCLDDRNKKLIDYCIWRHVFSWCSCGSSTTLLLLWILLVLLLLLLSYKNYVTNKQKANCIER